MYTRLLFQVEPCRTRPTVERHPRYARHGVVQVPVERYRLLFSEHIRKLGIVIIVTLLIVTTLIVLYLEHGEHRYRCIWC